MSRILAKMRSRRWTHNDYTELDLYDMDRNPLDLSGGGGDPTPPPAGGGEETKITTALSTTERTYGAGAFIGVAFQDIVAYDSSIELGAHTSGSYLEAPEHGLYFLRARFGFWENPNPTGSRREIRLRDAVTNEWIDGDVATPVPNGTGVGQTLLDIGGHHELAEGQNIAMDVFHDDYVSYGGELSPYAITGGYFAKFEMALVRRIPAAT